jgi:hypothetical protein
VFFLPFHRASNQYARDGVQDFIGCRPCFLSGAAIPWNSQFVIRRTNGEQTKGLSAIVFQLANTSPAPTVRKADHERSDPDEGVADI